MMMNFARLRHTCRNILFDKLNPIRANVSASYGHDMFLVEGFSTAEYQGVYNGKLSADYAVFKGKAALFISPISPKVERTANGWTNIKKGVLYFKFMPAIGIRKYDPEKKQGFSLSTQEIGSLISLGVDEACDFVHDPSMKTSDAGKIMKHFSVQPLEDRSGYFIRLSVTDNKIKYTQTISVPVTKAEFAVIRTAGSYILPHLMGWDLLSNQERTRSGLPGSFDATKQATSLASPLLEWDR